MLASVRRDLCAAPLSHTEQGHETVAEISIKKLEVKQRHLCFLLKQKQFNTNVKLVIR